MMETPLSAPLVRSVPQRSQSNPHRQSRTLQSIAARTCDVVHKKGERAESRSIRNDWQVRYSPCGLPHRCSSLPTACFLSVQESEWATFETCREPLARADQAIGRGPGRKVLRFDFRGDAGCSAEGGQMRRRQFI